MNAPVGRRILFGAIVTSGAWAAWNGVVFSLNPATRHRAEAAWFIFAALLLISGLSIGRRILADAASPAPLPRAWHAVALIGASLLLYSPVIGVGLLSDDFALLQRAREGALADPSWEYMRPLPLAMWRIVDASVPNAAVPDVLHVLNVVIHGINAWLVLVCAERLALGRAGGWLAAALFLTSPFNVEAVTWSSGIFDALLTTWILAAAGCLLSAHATSAARLVLVVTLTILAVATKETAVAAPLLLALLLPFVPRRHLRRAAVAVVSSAAITVAYAAWRVTLGVDSSRLVPSSGYQTKELLSRPFGAVGLGVHADVLAVLPLLAAMIAVAWPLLLVHAARAWHAHPRIFQMVGLGALWMLVSVTPLFTMFFVGADLQGSRYLYLGSSIWSIAVVSMIDGVADQLRRPWRTAVALAVIGLGAALTLAHQRPWIGAARERDRVLIALTAVPAECQILETTGLPDTVNGAYVFRNGFSDAAALVRSRPADARVGCRLRWNGSAFDVVP